MKPYDPESEVIAAMFRDDWAEVARLEKVIDALDVHPAPVTTHSAALYYASIGLHVFPLSPGSKIPFKGSGGCLDATTDPGQVDAWWTQNPNANLGIATGHLIDVIDIDGAEGVASWAGVYDELPPILGRVSTPRSGGNHLYVPAVVGRTNRAGIFPGIDYRGDGGYVVAPPSAIAAGDHPGAYRWITPLDLAAVSAIGAA